MSQYVTPPPSYTDREILLLLHQQLFMLDSKLYGNGNPGEIYLLHERISTLRAEQALLKSWQLQRSGGSDLLRVWVPIVIAGAALVIAWIRHS